jgi:multimeric flavodoxin WrbA
MVTVGEPGLGDAMVKVLGVSCSLRNARYGLGSEKLVAEINALSDEQSLGAYVEAQTKVRLNDFIHAGRGEGLQFDEIYRRLRKSRNDRGLSNSEAALVAGLWGACQDGAEIEHVGLGQYFPMTGEGVSLSQLRERVCAADAILVSGPVYFGDRGSIAQDFFEFLHDDEECSHHIKNRTYGGIAVGAKRNGGQETTLIYQLIDATNMNMLAVGNDTETTSQYGGTAVAGDVGTMHGDGYGIKTSIGTGRRVARVARMVEAGRRHRTRDKVKINIWLLQDTQDHRGRALMLKLGQELLQAQPGIEVRVLDFTEEKIYRCIACDICPIRVGAAAEYRCIIEADTDLFRARHEELIEADAILIGAYSPIDRRAVRSVYQRFTERTRYWRRDEYLIGDRLIAPLVISEIGANQNLHIRMLTSFLRHHTVLHHPLIGMEHLGVVLNWQAMLDQAKSFAVNAIELTAGRLVMSEEDSSTQTYNPVGYVISSKKKAEDIEAGRVRVAQEARRAETAETLRRRIDFA